MQDVSQPGMRLGFYNRGSTKETVDVGVLMSNPLKCKVVLLSVSAVHAAFHFQTCTKSLTTNLAKKTLTSLYRYTLWHNTEGKVSPSTVNHPLETTSIEWQYEQASLCADWSRGMPDTPREPSGQADCTAKLGGDRAAQAPGSCLSSQTSKEHTHSASQGGYTASEKCTGAKCWPNK